MGSVYLNKQTIIFIIKLVCIYALTYLIVGAIMYQLFMKQFYVGDEALFMAFLRSEANPDLWAHVNQWQLPILFLRSLLVALVLLPFAGTLQNFSFKKRWFVLFSLMFILTHIAAAAPSPGNLEGITYMRPELINPTVFAFIQPEMIVQSILFALGAAFIFKASNKGGVHATR